MPDTGDLRTDLLTAFCGMGGLTDHDTTSTFGAVMTALTHRPGVRRASSASRSSGRSRSCRAPSSSAPRDRGELRADLDLDLVVPALAGIVLHRVFVLGEQPGRRAHRARHRPDHPAGCQAAGLRTVKHSHDSTERHRQ